MTDGFVWDAGTDKERITEWPETKHILTEILQEIEKNNRELVYSHKVMYIISVSIHAPRLCGRTNSSCCKPIDHKKVNGY